MLETLTLRNRESLEETCLSLNVSHGSHFSNVFLLSCSGSGLPLGSCFEQNGLSMLLIAVYVIEVLGCQVLLQHLSEDVILVLTV